MHAGVDEWIEVDADGIADVEVGIAVEVEGIVDVEGAVADDVGGATVVVGGGGGVNPQIAVFSWAASALLVGSVPKSLVNVLFAPDASGDKIVPLTVGPIPITIIV